MSFKMKGSPAKMGTIQGTAGHSSALKKREDDINKLLEKRNRLKEKKEKREEKGKNTRRIDKRIERNQDKINKNPDAIKWKEDAEAKDEGIETVLNDDGTEMTEQQMEEADRKKRKEEAKKKKDKDKDETVEKDEEPLEKEQEWKAPKKDDTPPWMRERLGPTKMKGSPAKDRRNPPHRPHPDHHEGEENDGGADPNVAPRVEVRRAKEENTAYIEASDKKKAKLDKAYDKRTKLKEEGGDVKGSDKVDRKYRKIQNKINRLSGSKVRHRKNILTGGKYKKKIKK